MFVKEENFFISILRYVAIAQSLHSKQIIYVLSMSEQSGKNILLLFLSVRPKLKILDNIIVSVPRYIIFF